MLLATERLLLCDWSAEDMEVLLALSRDPEVMRYFPGPASREHIEALVARQQEALATGRPGLYSVHTRDTEPGGSRCIGFVGLMVPRFEAPFMESFRASGAPCVEIGWRLRRDAWGRGYASEAAGEVLRHAFETLGLPEIVSFTAVVNEPSRAGMRKLGMRHDPDGDFDHPFLEPGHLLERHVLYRLRAEEWRSSRSREAHRD